MSDGHILLEIYEKFATKKNLNILSEGIEHAISKTPMFLSDSDIEFLEQFDEPYWRQALKKRYELFANYLANLWQLRKVVFQETFAKQYEDAKNYFSQSNFPNLNPWVRNRMAYMQAQAAAKALAANKFPAGEDIKQNIVATSPEFKNLKPNQQKALSRVVRNINNYFLKDDVGIWGGFKDKNKAEESFGARSFLRQMAKEIEGPLGKPQGFDLSNPRRVSTMKPSDIDNEIERDAQTITDGFKIPTTQQIDDSIRRHLVSMGTNLAKPLDEKDIERRGLNPIMKKFDLTDDKGLDSITKQLRKRYENQINIQQAAAKKAAEDAGRGREFMPMTPNQIQKAAMQLMKQDLQSITNENFKRYLIKQMTGKEVKKDPAKLTPFEIKRLGLTPKQMKEILSIEDPFKGVGFYPSATGELVKNKNEKIQLPYKKITVQKYTGEKDEAGNQKFVPQEVEVPALTKTNLYKDVHLQYAHDFDETSPEPLWLDMPLVDNGQGVLVPDEQAGRGPKIFDKELFERLLRRVNALKTEKDKNRLQKIRANLVPFGLDAQSSMPAIVNAAKRFFKQAARPEEYKQGGTVSATFSHHPGRTSARANFMNRFRQKPEYEEKMQSLRDYGVKVRTRPTLDFVPFHEFVKYVVHGWLMPSRDGFDRLPKLIMRKSEDALVNLCTLRILENLNDPEMFETIEVDDEAAKAKNPDKPVPKKKIQVARSEPIRKEINLELKRYFDQNLMTGPMRRKGNFIEILEEDAEKELSCKQGQKTTSPGTCVQGMDLRTLHALFNDGMEEIEKSDDDDEEDVGSIRGSIVAERKKISQSVEGYYDIIKSLYGLYKLTETLNGVSDKDARVIAIKKITEFVNANIEKPDNQFLSDLYHEYTTVFDNLQKTHPKEMSGRQVAHDLRHTPKSKSPHYADQEYFLRRLRAKQAATLRGEGETIPTELAQENIGTMVNRLAELARDEPYKFARFYDIYTKGLDPNALAVFLPKAKPIKDKVDAIQNQLQTNMGTDMYDHFMFQGDFMDLEPSEAAASGEELVKKTAMYAKNLSDRALVHLVRHIEENMGYEFNKNDPDEKHIQTLQNRAKKQRTKAYRILKAEVEKRDLWSNLAASLENPLALLKK